MLNREDKADVKGAMGKAIANKIQKVTKDKYGLAKHKKMFDSGYHKEAVAKGESESNGNYSYGPNPNRFEKPPFR